MVQIAKRKSAPRVTFSPGGYKRAKKQYEQGRPHKLIRMMHEAGALDSHVDGCLLGRRSGFKKSWSLTPYDDSTRAAERLSFHRRVLEGLRLRDLLEDIHDGHLFLYHVIDFDWQVEGGRQVPTGHEPYEQRYFRYSDPDAPGFGELVIDRGHSSAAEPIPDTALVVEARKQPGMLPVLRDYILKTFGLESWASFVESFGEPFLMMKYPPGTSDEEKKEMDSQLEQIAASSRGRAPKGTELEVHEAGRDTGDHKDFTARSDKGIAVTLLGHANAVEDSGGVNVGGRQASYEVRHHVAETDMYFIEPYVNELIQTVHRLNFGDGRAPRWELNKTKPVDAKEHAEIIDVAHRHGARIHRSEYEKLDIRIDPDQEWLQRNAGPSLMD